MTDGYRRKLIEVALPLDDINREAAREKSIRHGHPSTLHLWWARRPLAAARAVLFGQLVDDPSAHPDKFKTIEEQDAEREKLFDIIRELVTWENSTNEEVLNKARAKIRESCGDSPPAILDPFAGGGTIPLEAQRLGLEAHASDLNPVAVLINKALIEIPPKWAGQPPVHPDAPRRLGGADAWRGAEGLAEDVRLYGKWMRDEAFKRIGHLYPRAKLPDGTMANVIAWIWARTVTCPNPACGGTMPLARSFWLGKKRGKERYVNPIPEGKQVRFEIRGPEGSPREGTVGRNGAECLLCSTHVPLAYIREEGKAGRIGAQLMAIAAEGKRTRHYLPPTDEHIKAADVPCPNDAPETELPQEALGFRVQNYGLTKHADLFTNRQLVALTTLSNLVSEARREVARTAIDSGIPEGKSKEYADAVATYLAFAVSRVAGTLTNLATWNSAPSKEGVTSVFRVQALAMKWDFGEANAFTDGQPSEIATSAEWIGRAIEILPCGFGLVEQADAADRRYGADAIIATDPPYYDNVPYADLSDFFYTWLRGTLRAIYPEIVGTLLTPKAAELIADPFRKGGRDAAEKFFEEGFRSVFSHVRSTASSSFPISVFYAFKQAEVNDGRHASTGWETLLEGMIDSGWSVTGTWPMRTERSGRSRDIESNSLASSVVLACRPRPEDAEMIDRRGFLSCLREELPERLRELQRGNIAPVDLVQAAIGPGMAVYSRYSKVAEPDGSAMRVRTALELINQVLDEVVAEQEGDLDRDSRWCVKWFMQLGWETGKYGDAETLAIALNTSVKGLERAGVVRQAAGKVSLIKPEDLPATYDPAKDERPTVWEAVMHMSRRLEEQGVESAAGFMAAARQIIDLDAAKELAYLLYNICERKRWAAHALRFNSLVTSWPDLVAAVRSAPLALGTGQLAMDVSFEED